MNIVSSPSTTQLPLLFPADCWSQLCMALFCIVGISSPRDHFLWVKFRIMIWAEEENPWEQKLFLAVCSAWFQWGGRSMGDLRAGVGSVVLTPAAWWGFDLCNHKRSLEKSWKVRWTILRYMQKNSNYLLHMPEPVASDERVNTAVGEGLIHFHLNWLQSYCTQKPKFRFYNFRCGVPSQNPATWLQWQIKFYDKEKKREESL